MQSQQSRTLLNCSLNRIERNLTAICTTSLPPQSSLTEIGLACPPANPWIMLFVYSTTIDRNTMVTANQTASEDANLLL